MNNNIDTHLGKKSSYTTKYDKNLLVRETRKINRDQIGIPPILPFKGYDTWNAYEVSVLTTSGFPVTGIIKIVYSANSKYIVESKSLKLYLYSFNMYRISNAIEQSISDLTFTIKNDLSNLLNTDVKVGFFSTDSVKRDAPNKQFFKLEDIVDTDKIKFTEYKENSKILIKEKNVNSEHYIFSNLLRSNCKITSQPDNGDIYIYYKTKNHKINDASLLKYIISYRDESHFHESVVESIYYKIFNCIKPQELLVKAYYVRRGGIDINPQRASSEDILDKDLMDINQLHNKTSRQ